MLTIFAFILIGLFLIILFEMFHYMKEYKYMVWIFGDIIGDDLYKSNFITLPFKQFNATLNHLIEVYYKESHVEPYNHMSIINHGPVIQLTYNDVDTYYYPRNNKVDIILASIKIIWLRITKKILVEGKRISW